MERYQERFEALGSEAVLTLVSDNQAAAMMQLTALRRQIEAFEQRFSRFLVDSELTRVNLTAGRRTTIDPEFAALLRASVEQAKASEGLFNPFVLPRLQEAGYRGSWSSDPATAKPPLYDDRTVAGVDDLVFGDDWVKLPPKTALDFGGIGKGYLLAELEARVGDGVTGVWFSLGGDVVVRGHDLDNMPWEVGVARALETNGWAGSFRNDGGRLAVATSGVTKRRGIHNGKPWHHLIDPRSGKPAETDLLTVTVASEDPVHADVAAKGAVIIGSHEAVAWLKRQKVKGALLQRIGTAGEVVVEEVG